MNSRRKFLKQVGQGAALSALALSSSSALASKLIPGLTDETPKPLSIGIIGAENSHSHICGKMFNIEKRFPGAEIKYIWGETEAFARKAMEVGAIPNMVKNPLDMMGKIDALIVDHRHPKFHLEAATPFVKAGIPTFVDKPFCYRVSEGKEFLAMAREHGTPVTSYSTIAHSDSTFDIAAQIKTLGEVNNVVRCGPADINSPYGGIFFYGVHLVQPLMYMFGDDIKTVKINKIGKTAGANLIYENGMVATLVFTNLHYGWETYVDTKAGMLELKSRVSETKPERCYRDMVEMFRTGKEPLSHNSILKYVAVLEAMEKSVKSDKWEDVRI
ncbi:MAG: Gfo/Idh/MocA family oxidoreductase [Bacteroidota bacterium]|nr:Gfo/Idh/MocA family oxidoreductase [Bacteroidota bacterium]